MKKFIIERSDDEFYTSHSGLALVGLGVNRFTKLNGKLSRAMPGSKTISDIDVIRSYKRRRIRTVIQELVYRASRLIVT